MVTKLRRRTLLMALWLLAAGTAVVIIGAEMDLAGQQPLPGEPTRQRLESIYDQAQAIINGVPMGGRSYFHRGKAVGVDGNVSVQSRASAFKKVTDVFVAGRWVMSDSERQDGEVVYAKLCKNGIATVLDGRGKTHDSTLYIGVIWAEDPNHVAWCKK